MTDLAQINATLAELSAQIFPPGMKLLYVSVDEPREQDINAQSMPKAMFDQLTANMRASGAPESVPLLAKSMRGTEIIIEIVSGHHRFRAARAAGIKYILCIVYENLTRSQIAAKQLAHNSISGTSDPELVKRIWAQITDVTARFEAFIDPRLFDNIKPVSFKPVDVDMTNTAKTVLLVFLPTQKLDFDAALEAILPKTNVDAVYLANKEVYDGWRAAFQRVRADLEIVNAPTALAEMARLALERLEHLQE